MLPAARSIIFLLRTQVQPVHPDFTEGIAIFFEIVAVTGVPVESACLFIEGFDTALDSDVDLRRQISRNGLSMISPSKPRCCLLSKSGSTTLMIWPRFIQPWSGAVVGFEMRQDFSPVRGVHRPFSAGRAMRQGDHAVMGKVGSFKNIGLDEI